MQPLYRIILKKAWEITKKYKFLWFFGIFALWLGNGGEMQIFFRTLYAVQDLSASKVPEILNSVLLIDFIKNAGDLTSILIWILIILIEMIIFILIVWIVTTSQTAIIKSTHDASNKKDIKFGKSFKEAQPYFFKVFGLNIVSEILVSIFIFLVIIPILLVVATAGTQLRFLIGIIIFAVFLPISIIISFVIRYAINFVVLKKEKFFDAILKGWYLFKSNWLVSLEMTFGLLIINSLVALIMAYLLILILGPFLRMDLLAVFAFQNMALGLIIWKLIPATIVFLLGGSFIAVFQIVSWTLLFNELVESKRYSKLERMLRYFASYAKTKNQINTVSDLNKIPDKEKTGTPKRRKTK